MDRRPVHAARFLTPVIPAGRRAARARGKLKIRVGAIMWIAGPVLFLIGQLVAQSAWRTRYKALCSGRRHQPQSR